MVCKLVDQSVGIFTAENFRPAAYPPVVGTEKSVNIQSMNLLKAGHRSNLASLRFGVNAATERRKHTQVDFMWITQRFRTIAVFPINWERLDAIVFTSMLPATKRKSRPFATRATDVISERKHCSRRRRHTQVELSSSRKCADKTQTIARKRWHGARKRKRWNVRSTCGRL